MRSFRCTKSAPFNFNIKKGFTWFHFLNPKPKLSSKAECEEDLPRWREESCETVVEEYLTYRVVNDSPTYFLPGNLYKVDNFIYSWDNGLQQWICVDSVEADEGIDFERDAVEMMERLFSSQE